MEVWNSLLCFAVDDYIESCQSKCLSAAFKNIYSGCCFYWRTAITSWRLGFLSLFFFLFFLQLHMQHVEVPGLQLWPTPQSRQHQIWPVSQLAGSLTRWVTQGVKPVSSWRPCRVFNSLSHNESLHFGSLEQFNMVVVPDRWGPM